MRVALVISLLGMMAAANAFLIAAVVLGAAPWYGAASVAGGANAAIGVLLRFPLAYYFR